MSKLVLLAAVLLATIALVSGATLPDIQCANCDRLIGTWEGFLYTRTYSTAGHAFPLALDDFGCTPETTMLAKAIKVVFKWVDNQVYYYFTVRQGESYDAEGKQFSTGSYQSKTEIGYTTITSLTANGLEARNFEQDPAPFCIPASFDWTTDTATIQFYTAGSDSPSCQDGIDINVACDATSQSAVSFVQVTKQ